MKYLVNRKTKEHTVATREDMMLVKEFGLNSDVFALVEADSEGWVAHTGKVCPLPDDVRCEIKFRNGQTDEHDRPHDFYWGKDGDISDITHYRPALEQAKPTPKSDYDPRSVSFNLLERLKAAHAQTQQIPDLEAELREVLGSMGYDLVARSPFVEPEAAVEPDMSDWRNWREGDWIECVARGAGLTLGNAYEVMSVDIGGVTIFADDDHSENSYYSRHFRFHSRPAKGEK